MKELTKEELLPLLSNLEGEIEYKLKASEVKLRKRDLPVLSSMGISQIFKCKEGNRKAIVGTSYTDLVNKQRGAEERIADFVAEAPKGKVHLEGSKNLLKGNTPNTDGTIYFNCQSLPDDGQTYYTDQDGRVLDKDSISFALPTVYENKSQDLTYAVMWITPKIESIESINVNNEWITLIG